MRQIYSFHQTVIGQMHMLNGIPCEDSSASFSSDDGRFSIAIVADGHGARECFRSDSGSRIATDVAMGSLKQFAETILSTEETEERFYRDIFLNPRYRQMSIKRLTDTIVAGWYDRVLDDFAQDPPSSDEINEYLGEDRQYDPTHYYGTTLIAALSMPKCLILLQQGDGRCDVFYKDGSVDQPIPWDSRCMDTATTSLCDEDAAESFRNCVIDTMTKPVMACYLGCDGVEDAYRDTYESLGGSHVLMGGVHTFFKYLTCQLVELGHENFGSFLAEMLPMFSANGKFSRSGSGDDVSVAGIVDLEDIKQFVDQYQFDVKLYALEEELSLAESELRSKMRKHGILERRVKEAKLQLEQMTTKHEDLKKEYQKKKEQREHIASQVEEAKADLDAYQKETQLASDQVEGKYARISAAVQRFFDDISSGYSQKEARYRELLEAMLTADEELKSDEEALQSSEREMEIYKAKLDEAQSAYNEYDAKYLAIDEKRKSIEEELNLFCGNDDQ